MAQVRASPSCYVSGCHAVPCLQLGEPAPQAAPAAEMDDAPPPVNTLKPLARCSSSADLMVGQKVRFCWVRQWGSVMLLSP